MFRNRFRNLERYRTGGDGDKMDLSVPLPKSAAGMVHRYCPDDTCVPRVFQLGGVTDNFDPSPVRVMGSRRQPHEDGATCPYCGCDDDDNEFTHPDDIEAVKKELGWAAKKDINNQMAEIATEFNRMVSRNNFLSIKMDVKKDHRSEEHTSELQSH